MSSSCVADLLDVLSWVQLDSNNVETKVDTGKTTIAIIQECNKLA